MAGSSAGSVAVDLVLNNRAFNNQVQNSVRSTENAFSSSFKKIGAVIATTFAVSKVVDFGKEAVKAAADSQAAWTGLNSIVQGTGNNFDVAHKFLTQYTKDGLVGIEDAATAYKSLLSRGYDTTQIENVMTALKDSAAFGRQSSYTLSEAVVSAAEGLKNENCILVDNAGVTKNVAMMWDEYAKSIGKTRNELTQQEKIQAEVNGILKETQFQTGDAATYTNTFAGRVQILKGAFSSMQIAIGKVVAPIAGLFIPAITAAINAVTAFFTKLQGVLKVFGLDFPDVVQKTTTGVSGATAAIGEMGSSAADTAKDIAGTGTAAKKAAKEAKKAFASVDEINVINTKSSDASSGSSGSSGGVGGSSAGTAVNTGNDAVSEAVGATASKIMKYIAPLQNISFDNLINAFNKVKEALAPIGKTLFAGLEWAYFNILVPLAEWTIEDALPAFFNLLAGALEVLNPILTAFGHIFEPVWNNLLKPILSWTGGAIVTVINGVADALSKVGNWMSENQGVVDAITATLLTFFGLWKLTELLAFIQMSGGVVAAFNLMTGSIVKNTAAKIVDKAETIYLTALYAKDFVVALAKGTAALVKNAAQWVATTAVKAAGTAATIASTVATTAATAATWLFNAALTVLTSPVFLVVAAIAALIAIVVLLVKNWDTVKAAGAKAWEFIKNAWNAASEWFKNTIITPISNFFSGMWNGLKNGAKNAWNGITSVFSNVTNWFKTQFTNAWTAVKNVFSTGGKIFDGIKDGIASTFKTVVNGIIGGINRVIAIPFNAINSALNKLRNLSFLGISPFTWLPRIGVPQIPKLAQGGWIGANNPQLAIVGDNKREGEIVAPESKIREQVKQAIAEMGTIGQKFVMDLNLKIQTDDGRTLIKKINDVQIEDGYISLMV
jgi:hypothetical protein